MSHITVVYSDAVMCCDIKSTREQWRVRYRSSNNNYSFTEEQTVKDVCVLSEKVQSCLM